MHLLDLLKAKKAGGNREDFLPAYEPASWTEQLSVHLPFYRGNGRGERVFHHLPSGLSSSPIRIFILRSSFEREDDDPLSGKSTEIAMKAPYLTTRDVLDQNI